MLYTSLAILRLRSIAKSVVPKAAAPQVPAATLYGVGGAFVAEWQRVFALRGVFILLFIGPLVYGIYYPQPYLNQILRKIPIAVVDNDQSDLSQRIVQTLDASGAVQVALRAETLAEARAALDRGEAFAVVGIPPGTERDVLKGTTVHSDLRRCNLPVHPPQHRKWNCRCDHYPVVRTGRRRRAHRW